MAERWQRLVRFGYLEDYCWTIWNIAVDNEIMYGEIMCGLYMEPGLIDGLIEANLWDRDPSPPHSPPRQPRRRRRRTRPSHPTRRSRRIARNRPRRSIRIQMMRWELQWGPPGVNGCFYSHKNDKRILMKFLKWSTTVSQIRPQTRKWGSIFHTHF